MLEWNTPPHVTSTHSGVDWSLGPTHRLGRVIPPWAQKVPEGKENRIWVSIRRFFPNSFSELNPFPHLFSLFHLHSLISSSSSLPPVPSLPASLQLLSCVLLRHAEQMLTEDAATTAGSARLWASCLDIGEGNGICLLLLGSLGTYHWILLLSWALLPEPGKDWQKVKPAILYLGDTRQPQKLPLLPSGVSTLKDPTNLSTWFSGAWGAFRRMCIWFSAQDLGTDHLPWS